MAQFCGHSTGHSHAVFVRASMSRLAILISSPSTMLYRRSIESVLWPEIFMRTTWGTPARRMLRTAVLRRSWNFRSGTPARSQAFAHVPRRSLIGSPRRLKTHGLSGHFSTRCFLASASKLRISPDRIGTARPSPFFVSPVWRTIEPDSKSTCSHLIASSSPSRIPVSYLNPAHSTT